MDLNGALELFKFSKEDRFTQAELKKKHRSLMKKYHADVGGDDFFAKQVNEAFDLLKEYIDTGYKDFRAEAEQQKRNREDERRRRTAEQAREEQAKARQEYDQNEFKDTFSDWVDSDLKNRLLHTKIESAVQDETANMYGNRLLRLILFICVITFIVNGHDVLMQKLRSYASHHDREEYRLEKERKEFEKLPHREQFKIRNPGPVEGYEVPKIITCHQEYIKEEAAQGVRYAAENYDWQLTQLAALSIQLQDPASFEAHTYQNSDVIFTFQTTHTLEDGSWRKTKPYIYKEPPGHGKCRKKH